MKRPFSFLLMTLVVLILTGYGLVGLAAPAAQEARPVIAQPAQDAPVRGVVQIVGSATHPQFQRYELYYALWPVPSDQSWIFIGDAHFNQQALGLLGTWDSRSVTDGAYGLRVRVVKQDGNYLDSDPRRVQVANSRPFESLTPEVTAETPEPLPFSTDEPPTPAGADVQPTAAATPTVAPTPTPEPAVTPILSSTQGATQSSAGGGSATAQLVATAKLLDTAKTAALYTVAAFALVGAFFAVKALLVWLWQKIRP